MNVFKFLWCWFLVSSYCDPRRRLVWFQFSWICWGLFCVLPCGLSWKMFHVHFKRMYILLICSARFYIYQLNPFDLVCRSMLQYSCWFFGKSIHCWLWAVKIPYDDCIAVDLLLKFLLIYLGALMLGSCLFIMFMSSWWVLPLSYEMSFYVSFYGFCFEFYFVGSKHCYTGFFSCPFAWNDFFQLFTFSLCKSLVLRRET